MKKGRSSQQSIARAVRYITPETQSDQPPQSVDTDAALINAFRPPNMPKIPPHIQREIIAGELAPPKSKRDLRRLLSGEFPGMVVDAARRETRPRSNSARSFASA